MKIQVLDLCEIYEEHGSELAVQCAMLIGKTKEGQVVRHVFRDLKHECFLAVSEHFSLSAARELASDLNEHLVSKRRWCPIQGTGNCVCTDRKVYDAKTETSAPIVTGCCGRYQQTDLAAVKAVDLHRGNGFLGYEPQPRPFIRFEFTRSYYANKATTDYLMKAVQRDRALPDRYKGVFEMAPKLAESFVNSTKLAGFEWFDTETNQKLDPQPPDTEMVPLRTMCFDIETPTDRGFPTPFRGDKVAMVTGMCLPDIRIKCYVLGQTKANYRVAQRFGVKENVPIMLDETGEPIKWKYFDQELKMYAKLREWDEQGLIEVQYFDEERHLLEAFVRECIHEYDPDILAHFNGNNFDIPFIMERLRILQSPLWNNWSRLGPAHPIQYHSQVPKSNQKGAMKKTTIYCPGRVSLDVMQNVKDDGNLKLNSYGLDAVCEAYELGSKGDVAPEEMWGRLNGTENDRGELLFYNILDVVLTARVLEVRLIVKSTAINSKVFRTFPSEMVTRGISYTLSRFIISRTYGKWMSPALHFDNELQRKRLHPKIVDVEEELKLRQTGIGGGLVLEPVPAYYDVPVAVLDYASLYPSIIRAHNICPTTWIRSKQELQEFGLTLDDVFVTPNQAMFVKPHIRRGILPVMLEELMDQRAATRKEQKKWLKVDVTRWEVLESIQLAFKLAANSTYGVLATHYLDFCLMVIKHFMS